MHTDLRYGNRVFRQQAPLWPAGTPMDEKRKAHGLHGFTRILFLLSDPCESVPIRERAVLFSKQTDPARLVVVEAWESVEAHQATAGRIPRDMLAQARALLAATPSAGYFDAVEERHAAL